MKAYAIAIDAYTDMQGGGYTDTVVTTWCGYMGKPEENQFHLTREGAQKEIEKRNSSAEHIVEIEINE